jgi:hypothetical protein
VSVFHVSQRRFIGKWDTLRAKSTNIRTYSIITVLGPSTGRSKLLSAALEIPIFHQLYKLILKWSNPRLFNIGMG